MVIVLLFIINVGVYMAKSTFDNFGFKIITYIVSCENENYRYGNFCTQPLNLAVGDIVTFAINPLI